jgi:hypothetical protein
MALISIFQIILITLILILVSVVILCFEMNARD